jgi:hypothetical protein
LGVKECERIHGAASIDLSEPGRCVIAHGAAGKVIERFEMSG